MIVETKKRTVAKSAAWRIIATVNSFTILCIGLGNNLYSAIAMNITGFALYYLFERICNKIKWGRNENSDIG